MIGQDLLRYNKEQKYLVWDLETTGLCLGYALPWQLSYQLFTLDKVLEEQNFYIWWDNLPISADAARITRFDHHEYKRQALEPDKVLKSFEAMLYDPSIRSVFHNGLGYDCMIHNVWRRKVGLKEDYSYLPRSFDTVCLSKAYKKGFKIPKDDFFSFQMKLSRYVERGLKTNLAAMGREFKIDFNADLLHDAKQDIRLNAEVFKQLIWKLEI
jgi:DNA polymerase III alpha subunit (gram-positive type)